MMIESTVKATEHQRRATREILASLDGMAHWEAVLVLDNVQAILGRAVIHLDDPGFLEALETIGSERFELHW